jgi:hypothetical protein
MLTIGLHILGIPMLQGKDNLSELLNVPVRFHVLIRGLVHLVKEISDTFPCDS